jgi:NADH-quinone oxidoreductase subunit J
MSWLFYISGALAVISSVLAISRMNPVHGLLYFIVSLFSSAMVLLSLGAPFAAALEVIIYAGAIMVLFIFIIMLTNPGLENRGYEQGIATLRFWIGPSIIVLVLLVQIVFAIIFSPENALVQNEIGPKPVGIALFGPYVLAVELASMLLLAGIIGALHLGRKLDLNEDAT